MCQVVNRSNLLLVAHRKTVKDRDALDGARVTLWGSSFRSAYIGYFKTAGVQPRILPQFFSVNLFLTGGADACAAMEYNEYETIIQSGVDPEDLTVFSLRNNGFGFPEDGVYATSRTARRNPELCRAFAQATLQGWAYCRAHPAEAVASVMRHAREAHVPTNAVHQRWMLDHILASIYPGKADAWKPGRARARGLRAHARGHDRAGADRVGALLRALRREGRPQCSVACPSPGASRCSCCSARGSCWAS